MGVRGQPTRIGMEANAGPFYNLSGIPGECFKAICLKSGVPVTEKCGG